MTSSLLVVLAVMQASTLRQQADLSLSVACGARPNEVMLTIQNPSDANTAVLLGYALGNGRSYLPRELVVEIKRPQDSDFERLLHEGPTGIVGRIDHWIVTLPARAHFILPLRASDFAATKAGFRILAAPPDELRVRLNARSIVADLSLDMARMRQWQLWTGTAVSNTLRWAAECVR